MFQSTPRTRRSLALLRRGLLLLALPLLLPSGPLGAQAIDLSGRWRFEVTTDAGVGTPLVELRQVGDSLSGRYLSDQLGNAELRGTVRGNAITFTFRVELEGTPLTVTYSGTIESATAMRGNMDLGGLAGGTFTAKPEEP